MRSAVAVRHPDASSVADRQRRGESLKLLMAINEPACDKRAGAGALAAVPPAPPQPASGATATMAATATATTGVLARVRRACEESKWSLCAHC
jgi:hypothetical protein